MVEVGNVKRGDRAAYVSSSATRKGYAIKVSFEGLSGVVRDGKLPKKPLMWQHARNGTSVEFLSLCVIKEAKKFP